MPIDFSVEGLVEAVDNVSEPMGDIARSVAEASGSMENASESAEDASNSFVELAGAAKTLDFGMNRVEESFEDLNNDVQEGLVNLQAMQAQMGSTAASAQLLNASVMDFDAENLIEKDVFRENLFGELAESGQDRMGLGGAIGNFVQSDESTLRELSKRIASRSDLDIDIDAATEGVAEAASELAVYSTAAERAEDKSEEVADEMNGISVSSVGLVQSLTLADSALGAFTLALSQTEEKVDDVEEEVEDLRNALVSLLPALSCVSANLGPFNFALRNVLVTIPMLLATFGPLLTLIAALATAFVTAGAALAAFAGAGAFLLAKQLEESFIGVKDTAEAFKAIVKGLGMALKEAIAPLFGAEIGGLSAIEFFVRVMQDLVLFVRLISEAFAELLGMEEVASFFFRIEDAMLGLGDETGGLTMLEGLKELMREVLPVVTDLVVFLIDELPDAMAFMADITDETAPAIGELSIVLIDLSTTMIHIGAIIMDVLLPGLSRMIAAFNFLLEVLLALHEALGPLGDLILIMITVFVGLTIVILKLVSLAITLAEIWALLSELGIALSVSMGAVLIALTALVSGFLLLTGALDIMPGILDRVIGAFLVLSGAIVLAAQVSTMSIAQITGALLSSGWGAAIIAVGLMVAVIIKFRDQWPLLADVAIGAIAAITVALLTSGWGSILIAIGILLTTLILKWDELSNVVDSSIKSINSELQEFFMWLGLSKEMSDELADAVTNLIRLFLMLLNPLGLVQSLLTEGLNAPAIQRLREIMDSINFGAEGVTSSVQQFINGGGDSGGGTVPVSGSNTTNRNQTQNNVNVQVNSGRDGIGERTLGRIVNGVRRAVGIEQERQGR